MRVSATAVCVLLLLAVGCCATHIADHELDDVTARSLEAVKKVLGKNRNPVYAGDAGHTYTDKYQLAEYLGSMTGTTMLQTLLALGLKEEDVPAVHKAVMDSKVTLRFDVTKKCNFIEKRSREVKDKRDTLSLGSVMRLSTTVDEWFWRYEVDARVVLVTEAGERPLVLRELHSSQASMVYKTLTDAAPFPTVHSSTTEAPVDWIFEPIEKDLSEVHFSIDRTDKRCFTPRRNPVMDRVLEETQEMAKWGRDVERGLMQVFSVQLEAGKHEDTGKAAGRDKIGLGFMKNNVLIPAVPVLDGGRVLNQETGRELMARHKTMLSDELLDISAKLPDKNLVTADLGRVMFLARHLRRLSTAFGSGVADIEGMLRRQLVAAIGEEVTEADFNKYMVRHNKRLFVERVSPKPLVVSVRRGATQAPEGSVGLFTTAGGEPVQALQSSLPGAELRMDLDAANTISLNATKRVVHGWMSYVFGGEPARVRLTARARQFSTYIMVLCKQGEGASLLPSDAIVLRNGDKLDVEVLLKVLPAPKEFEDHIASLSPNQQRFAKAYRRMQLAGSLLSVVLIQVKPQLERLLNVPTDTLTKETRLTQEVLELFMKHDISADLLSYEPSMDGEGLSPKQRVDAVRAHVDGMNEMIDRITNKSLDKKKKEREYRKEDRAGVRYADDETEVFMTKPTKVVIRNEYASTAVLLNDEEDISPTPPTPPTPSSTEAKTAPEEDAGRSDRLSDLPFVFETSLKEHDEEAAVKPTTVSVGEEWTKESKEDILAKAVKKYLTKENRKDEQEHAFGLLDALTKSGTLPLECEVHTLFTATHRFERTLLDTVVKDDKNPIDHVERSTLILASSLRNEAATDMVFEDLRPALASFSPTLFKK